MEIHRYNFIIILSLVFLFLFFAMPSRAALVGNTTQATLSFSPQSGTYNANDSIPVSIYLNTNGQNVVVVAAYLNYDTAHFQAISIDTTNSVFSMEAEKNIDSVNGVIKITRGNPSASHVNSSNALVAVINLRAISGTTPSSDNLNFQFVAGSTMDSNVIKDDGLGTDILSGVYNAMYTVSGAGDTTAPTISSVSASSVTSNSATISWTTNEASDSQVEYGTTATYGSQTTLNSSMVTSHSQSLSGLSPSTTHHYRVKSRDAAGNLASGTDNTFVTSVGVDTTAPTISGGSPSGSLVAGTTQTTMSVTTNENATCRYSTVANVAYASMTNIFSTTGATSHSSTISGLSNGNSYNYYVRCQDTALNTNSSDYVISFSVASPSDTQAPNLYSILASSITSNSATVSWTTDEAANSQVEYGTSASYGSQTSLNSSFVTSHSVLLSGLSPSTTYHYRVKSRDAASNLATGGDNTFSTIAAVTTLTVSLSANPSSGTAPLNGVDLLAAVSGSATGNINYTFYCNRSDTGINITSPNQGKYDNISTVSYNAADICSYSNAGSYTAKVIAERGGYQAEAKVGITVNTAPTPPPTGNSLPVGHVDGADSIHVSGWAYDADAGTSPIAVHIYVDGVINGSAIANLSRPDIVGTLGGAVKDGNHGFDYSFSSLSGGTHTIRVFAINTPEGSNPELTGSPKTIGPGSSSSPLPPCCNNDSGLPYPNGSILTAPGSDKIYFIVDNQKCWLTSPSVYLSYGLPSGGQQTVSQTDLDKYPTGPDINNPSLVIGTLIRARGDSKVWIIKPPFKRHIFNPAIFGMYQHFSWSSIKEVDQSVVDSYAISDLYQADTDYRVYSLEELDEVNGIAIKHHLNLTTDQFTVKGYSWNQIFIVNAKERDYYQTGTDYTN